MNKQRFGVWPITTKHFDKLSLEHWIEYDYCWWTKIYGTQMANYIWLQDLPNQIRSAYTNFIARKTRGEERREKKVLTFWSMIFLSLFSFWQSF